MDNNTLPLKELSINDLFNECEKLIFEIPIYQRNYAWEKDEITALVQDIYDYFIKDSQKPYYIGTLVTYHKGDNVFEVIDGQQRLTTICLLLSALGFNYNNKLTYRARKKSDNTINYIKEYKNFNENNETHKKEKNNTTPESKINIKQIPSFDIDDKDIGIINGYKYIEQALKEIVSKDNSLDFPSYFLKNVHIIHYQVPKDIDLNHYFEIMNSRGEQLEKHEIVKAELMSILDENDRKVFSIIWNACFEMGIYIQQNIKGINVDGIFGNDLSVFSLKRFDDLKIKEENSENKINTNTNDNKETEIETGTGTGTKLYNIRNIIDGEFGFGKEEKKDETKDKFQPIIDFPNFLLIVLKITLLNENRSTENQLSDNDKLDDNVILDDKELLKEFNKITEDKYKELIKKFAFNLLKSRFYLDNYVVHRSNEEENEYSNPWCLEVLSKNEGNYNPKNICDDDDKQMTLKQLLSMFEVSYSAKQRKNYLFYILYYLVKNGHDINDYTKFVNNLADNYFYNFYLYEDKLNASNNTPLSRSFDDVIIKDYEIVLDKVNNKNKNEKIKLFTDIYGDGINKASKGIPLFIFNYLNYKIWKLYYNNIRGKNYNKESNKRIDYFENILGCSDFGLDIFDNFYFSRTRRSLEHFYPQAKAVDDSKKQQKTDNILTRTEINCFGNYAMIGSEANSSGSNWDPKTKVVHYLDKKINRVSVGSLKFWIMMQICDKDGWTLGQIQAHQEKMLKLLSEDTPQEQTTTSSQDSNN